MLMQLRWILRSLHMMYEHRIKDNQRFPHSLKLTATKHKERHGLHLKKVLQVIIDNRKMKLQETADIVKISKGSALTIHII